MPAILLFNKRLFSAVRWNLMCLCKRVSPSFFGSLLFLRMNIAFWDLKLLSAAIKMNPKDQYLTLDDDEIKKQRGLITSHKLCVRL